MPALVDDEATPPPNPIEESQEGRKSLPPRDAVPPGQAGGDVEIEGPLPLDRTGEDVDIGEPLSVPHSGEVQEPAAVVAATSTAVGGEVEEERKKRGDDDHHHHDDGPRGDGPEGGGGSEAGGGVPEPPPTPLSPAVSVVTAVLPEQAQQAISYLFQLPRSLSGIRLRETAAPVSTALLPLFRYTK
jgi:hypothetical protein